MRREYTITEQPSGVWSVAEGLLDVEGHCIKGLWSTAEADIVSATFAIQEHEKQFLNRGDQFVVVGEEVYQKVH